MEDRVFFVTGATDGVGRHTARRLAQTGATVLIHGRDPLRLENTVLELKKINQNITGYVADFASLSAIHKLSDEVHATQTRIDVLINNAGVYNASREESLDGHELTLAVNVLAPFLLTSLFLDLLRVGHQSHVINVSSDSHLKATFFDVDNLQFRVEYPRDGHAAYEQSKLCEIMFTLDMAEKFRGSIPRVNCLDPGTINTKMLLEGWGDWGIPVTEADEVYHLATDSKFAEISGEYFTSLKKTKALNIAYNHEMRGKLWHCLVEMTGAKF